MKIDSVSQKIVIIALYLDKLKPGTVSEIWLDNDLISELRELMPSENEVERHITSTKEEISQLKDVRRRQYLNDILKSLEYQINNLHSEIINLEEFTLNCFGVIIPKVKEDEIQRHIIKIEKLERKIGKSVLQILKKNNMKIDDIEKNFVNNLNDAKKLVFKKLSLDLPKTEKFIFKTARGESWSAFNKHIGKYYSELILNLDYPINRRDIRYLAFHEGYGGHHTELTLKDKLLVQEGRGEHGLVITYSPQTFMSEAIAVNSQSIFDTKDEVDEINLISLYDELTGGILLNRVAYMYHNDKQSLSNIRDYLKGFNISDDSRDFIINFSTDKTYGIYTLLYYFAGIFFSTKLKEKKDPIRFLQDVYTLPTTPKMLE